MFADGFLLPEPTENLLFVRIIVRFQTLGLDVGSTLGPAVGSHLLSDPINLLADLTLGK